MNYNHRVVDLRLSAIAITTVAIVADVRLRRLWFPCQMDGFSANFMQNLIGLCCFAVVFHISRQFPIPIGPIQAYSFGKKMRQKLPLLVAACVGTPTKWKHKKRLFTKCWEVVSIVWCFVYSSNFQANNTKWQKDFHLYPIYNFFYSRAFALLDRCYCCRCRHRRCYSA